MKSSACCGSSPVAPRVSTTTNARPAGSGKPAFIRRFSEIFKLLVPGTLLLLIPKCPFCVAAYFAFLTGFGITLTTASYLRISLIVLCSISILYLTLKIFRRKVTMPTLKRSVRA